RSSSRRLRPMGRTARVTTPRAAPTARCRSTVMRSRPDRGQTISDDATDGLAITPGHHLPPKIVRQPLSRARHPDPGLSQSYYLQSAADFMAASASFLFL